MSASIGSLACFCLRGTLPVAKQKLAVWTVPGVNGYGAQQLGKQDQEFAVSAVFYGLTDGSSADIDNWWQNLCGLQGTVVTITDDYGIATANCLIIEVGPAQRAAAWGPGITQRIEAGVKGVIRA